MGEDQEVRVAEALWPSLHSLSSGSSGVLAILLMPLGASALGIPLYLAHHPPPRPWGSPGKNTGVDCHALLQGIFLTQESKPGLLCLLY